MPLFLWCVVSLSGFEGVAGLIGHRLDPKCRREPVSASSNRKAENGRHRTVSPAARADELAQGLSPGIIPRNETPRINQWLLNLGVNLTDDGRKQIEGVTEKLGNFGTTRA
jgi:hypothetical protein